MLLQSLEFPWVSQTVTHKILCYLLTLYSLSTHCSLIRNAEVVKNIHDSCQVTDKSQERSEADISRTEAAFTTFTLNRTQRAVHKAQIFLSFVWGSIFYGNGLI